MVINLRKKYLKISRYELLAFKNDETIKFLTGTQCRYIEYFEGYDSCFTEYTIFPIIDSWNLDKPKVAEKHILNYFLAIKKYCDDHNIKCKLILNEDNFKDKLLKLLRIR